MSVHNGVKEQTRECVHMCMTVPNKGARARGSMGRTRGMCAGECNSVAQECARMAPSKRRHKGV